MRKDTTKRRAVRKARSQPVTELPPSGRIVIDLAKAAQVPADLRTPEQWDKFDMQIDSIVRHLINGDDDNAKDLVVLMRLISNEQGVDKDNLVDKIARDAFVHTCDFFDVLRSWQQEVCAGMEAQQ